MDHDETLGCLYCTSPAPHVTIKFSSSSVQALTCVKTFSISVFFSAVHFLSDISFCKWAVRIGSTESVHIWAVWLHHSNPKTKWIERAVKRESTHTLPPDKTQWAFSACVNHSSSTEVSRVMLIYIRWGFGPMFPVCHFWYSLVSCWKRTWLGTLYIFSKQNLFHPFLPAPYFKPTMGNALEV